MSKLNLDIFEQRATIQPQDERKNITTTGRTEGFTSHSSEEATRAQQLANHTREREAPKFVPVGFYENHLRILDEAVLQLRRKGFWKASKSALIRGLIERHASELTVVPSRENSKSKTESTGLHQTPKS